MVFSGEWVIHFAGGVYLKRMYDQKKVGVRIRALFLI